MIAATIWVRCDWTLLDPAARFERI